MGVIHHTYYIYRYSFNGPYYDTFSARMSPVDGMKPAAMPFLTDRLDYKQPTAN